METQAKVYKPSIGTLLKSLCFLLISFTASADTLVQNWQNLRPEGKGLTFEPRITFYSSHHNFDSEGESFQLNQPKPISRTYFDLNLSHFLSSEFYWLARVSLLSQMNPSLFGLSDQLVGAGYIFRSDPKQWALSAQLETSIPLYQNQNESSSLGDQSIDTTAGFFARKTLPWNLELETGVGLTYRTRQFSAAIPYSMIFRRTQSKRGFIFGVGFNALHSLKTDPSSPLDESRTYLVNAVNPSWIKSRIQLGYQRSSTQQLVFEWNRFAGKNTAAGWQMNLSAKFEIGSSDDDRRSIESERTPLYTDETDLEARVVSVNDQLYLVKIDSGSSDGIEKGQVFDIFAVARDTQASDADQLKTENPLARAQVSYVKNDKAVLNVVEYYRDQWIEQGCVAKRVKEKP
jgi:hypothetical protein